MRSIIIVFLAVFLTGAITTGCATVSGNNTISASSARPDWIDHPGEGVSASAAFHVKGRAAQEELAVSRAREELAKRQGVLIDSQNNIQQQYASERLSTVTDKQIQETVTGIEIKSQIKAKWFDPETEILWVWVVPER